MTRYCQLSLTCSNKSEATKVAAKLLNMRLVACAKQVAVTSDFRWLDKIEHDDEVMLIMDSRLDLFDKVEAEVKKLHSYDSFVLQATAIERVSKDAKAWLKKELQK